MHEKIPNVTAPQSQTHERFVKRSPLNKKVLVGMQDYISFDDNLERSLFNPNLPILKSFKINKNLQKKAINIRFDNSYLDTHSETYHKIIPITDKFFVIVHDKRFVCDSIATVFSSFNLSSKYLREPSNKNLLQRISL